MIKKGGGVKIILHNNSRKKKKVHSQKELFFEGFVFGEYFQVHAQEEEFDVYGVQTKHGKP